MMNIRVDFYYIQHKKLIMDLSRRVMTIDVMRGLTLFLMLFVNDLYSPGVPAWLTHRPADFDGMGLADWVFPGFLFMVGMAIPFAISSRLKRGDRQWKITGHILIRTVSLLIIGVLMLNVSRLNSELAGINRNLWAILVYLSIFLIWNNYKNEKNNLTYSLKALGVIGLLVLIIIFKGGTAEEVTWLRTGWWGILGLIGWGYFVTALFYLFAKDNILGTALIWVFFLCLNILSQLHLLDFLNFLNPVFGVILGGNVPSIVLAGLVFSLILRKTGFSSVQRFLITGFILGVLVFASGFILRNWFIISKIKATPSWGLICNGISIFLFMILFVIIDIMGKKNWVKVFLPAGANSLTTYLAPDILYYTIWMLSLPILVYKHSEYPLIVAGGSVVWAFAMIGFAVLLSKVGIRLKL